MRPTRSCIVRRRLHLHAACQQRHDDKHQGCPARGSRSACPGGPPHRSASPAAVLLDHAAAGREGQPNGAPGACLHHRSRRGPPGVRSAPRGLATYPLLRAALQKTPVCPAAERRLPHRRPGARLLERLQQAWGSRCWQCALCASLYAKAVKTPVLSGGPWPDASAYRCALSSVGTVVEAPQIHQFEWCRGRLSKGWNGSVC